MHRPLGGCPSALRAGFFGLYRQPRSPAAPVDRGDSGQNQRMELAQVRLVVTQFGPMFRFYRDVLGLKPQVDDERGPYAKLSLPQGNAAIALQSRAHLLETFPALESGVGDRAVIAIRVDDLDATVAALRARGAAFVTEPTTAWGRLKLVHLRDPEQNLIELQQWLVVASSPSA
jgi:lactoylglutathione lyase